MNSDEMKVKAAQKAMDYVESGMKLGAWNRIDGSKICGSGGSSCGGGTGHCLRTNFRGYQIAGSRPLIYR